MSTWNYQILADVDKNNQIYFQVHEAYYNKDGKPDGYSENPITIGSETIDDLKWTVDRIKECFNKSILWAGDRFPEEYVE